MLILYTAHCWMNDGIYTYVTEQVLKIPINCQKEIICLTRRKQVEQEKLQSTCHGSDITLLNQVCFNWQTKNNLIWKIRFTQQVLTTISTNIYINRPDSLLFEPYLHFNTWKDNILKMFMLENFRWVKKTYYLSYLPSMFILHTGKEALQVLSISSLFWCLCFKARGKVRFNINERSEVLFSDEEAPAEIWKGTCLASKLAQMQVFQLFK